MSEQQPGDAMDGSAPVQHFSLRWNNFQTTITSALAGLRDTQEFVDVTLWTDGRQIKAHKNVLSACSPVLLDLLKDNPCSHPIIILHGVTHGDLSAIVTYMYQGEVNVAPESLRTFLHTAQLLKVKGLADTGLQQEADACMYDSPVSASSESPRPVSPPKRHRPLSPPLPAAAAASTLPLLPALNGRASPLCSTPEPAAPPGPARVETAEEGGLSGQELVVAVEELENGEIGMDVLPVNSSGNLDSMHSPVRRSRWCEACEKVIVRDFARHKREVHGEAKPLPCDLCGSVFKYKRSLQVHVKRKHDISWVDYRAAVNAGIPLLPDLPQDLRKRPTGGGGERTADAKKSSRAGSFPLAERDRTLREEGGAT